MNATRRFLVLVLSCVAGFAMSGPIGAAPASASSAIGINGNDYDSIVALTGYPGWVRMAPEYPLDTNAYAVQMVNARSRGLKVLVTGLGSFQACNCAHSMPVVGNQTQQQNYVNYIEQLLTIGNGPDAIGPWNEPNLEGFGGPGSTWQQDANLQADVAWAAAVVGWHGTFFSSALAGYGSSNSSDPRVPLNWWKNELAGDASWAGRFSVLDVHAYGWGYAKTLKTIEDQYNPGVMQAKMQDIIAYSGGGWKKLAWTEYGAPSNGDIVDPGSCNPNVVSQWHGTPTFQYNWYLDAHAFWKAWEDAGRQLWGKLAYRDTDNPYERDCHNSPFHYGLIGSTGLRPAAGAYQVEATRVRPPP
ncbi:MAG: hypothetical protein JWL83_902 [Actinomycetia bacterium]|nr:hypothetical protein [Actinomycetes bacterium]